MADGREAPHDPALAPLVAFGRDLRARGVPVGTGRIVTLLRAVASLGLVDRASLYWAGRVSLVASRPDLDAYDVAFDTWYRSLAPSDAELTIELSLPTEVPDVAEGPEGLRVEIPATAGSWRSAHEEDEPEPGDESSIRIVASGVEVLRAKSFADLTEEERHRVASMIDDLTVRAPVERTRRTRPARKGSAFDLRRTLRRTLRAKDPDRAMREIGKLVEDWEGGTRIGESLKTLLDGWSQRAALRGAVVVLCSDGLERGDPALLRAQMARMRRLAHRVVWANPLKGSPRYEPLARGMAAALPSVDVFLSGHNLESLESLAAVLGA